MHTLCHCEPKGHITVPLLFNESIQILASSLTATRSVKLITKYLLSGSQCGVNDLLFIAIWCCVQYVVCTSYMM